MVTDINSAAPPLSASLVLGGVALLVSVALLALTLFVAPRLIARLPPDYFTRPPPPGPVGLVEATRSVMRSALGALSVVLGIVMLVTPGPGLVFILIGLSMARFPGKHRLTRHIITRRGVLAALNWMRQRHQRPPFVAPGPRAPTPATDRMHLLPVLVCIGAMAQGLPEPARAQSAEAQQPLTADDVATRISETDQRLQALDAELASNRAERERLAAQLAAADTAANERRSRVAELDQDIGRYESTLRSLETRVAAERATLEARRQRIANMVRRGYEAEDTNPVAVLLAHQDPAMADRLSVWTGYVLRARRDEIDSQRVAIERIEAAYQDALKDRNWLDYIRRKAERQRDGQIAAAEASRADIDSVDVRITETTRNVETLRADAARLGSLLDELRAAEASRSGYFENGKGSWAMPVAGRIDARFGDAKSVGQLVWDGWFVRADAGTPVRAVADGEVVYSDWLRGFGQLVILEHGDGYMSLYGGNRENDVLVGDWAEAGATIATVGDSGGQNTTGLYFEIRHDARPIDPAPWLVQ